MDLKLYEVTDKKYVRFLKDKGGRYLMAKIESRPHILVIINHREYLIPLSTSTKKANGESKQNTLGILVMPDDLGIVAISKMFPVAKGMYRPICLEKYKYSFDYRTRVASQKFIEENFFQIQSMAEKFYAINVGDLEIAKSHNPIKDDLQRMEAGELGQFIYKSKIKGKAHSSLGFKDFELLLEKFVSEHNLKIGEDLKAHDDFASLGFKYLKPSEETSLGKRKPRAKKYEIVLHPKVPYKYESKEKTRRE